MSVCVSHVVLESEMKKGLIIPVLFFFFLGFTNNGVAVVGW